MMNFIRLSPYESVRTKGRILMAQRVQMSSPSRSEGSERSQDPLSRSWGSDQTQVQPTRPPNSVTPPSPANVNRPQNGKPQGICFQRVWEPNERAFTVLVPKGWQIAGGIFNVNPLKTNGPGNTLSPKCDYAVKTTPRGPSCSDGCRAGTTRISPNHPPDIAFSNPANITRVCWSNPC